VLPVSQARVISRRYSRELSGSHRVVIVRSIGEVVSHLNGPARIGLISDTHGLMRKEALRALEGCEFIIHAGDVGARNVLEELRAVAPVVAVRGNVDKGDWASELPVTTIVEARSALIFVLHDIKELDLDPAAAGFGIVVSGHSHKPDQSERAGVRYINPGSAGPRRFKLPVTVALLDLVKSPKAEFIHLERNGFTT
jgi:uncharacterized protein